MCVLLRIFAYSCRKIARFLWENCRHFLLDSMQVRNFLGTCPAQNMGLLCLFSRFQENLIYFNVYSGLVYTKAFFERLSDLFFPPIFTNWQVWFSYLALDRSTLFDNMQKGPSSMPRYFSSASFWQFNVVQVCF